MKGWEQDKLWSDRYLPQIRQIVGPCLLEPANDELDQHEATDLIILKARDLRIACRIRSPKYESSYPWEFTVRSFRPSGRKTELEKILDGFGDLMFYGHADTHHRVHRYFLIDLDWFRAVIQYDNRFNRWLPNNGAAIQKTNFDGSSNFIAYDIRYFPQEVIKLSSHEIPFSPLLTWNHFRQTVIEHKEAA